MTVAMPRIFIAPERIAGGVATFAGEDLRRVRTVLRLRAGAELTLTDGTGREYAARIDRLGRDAGSATLLAAAEPGRESPLRTVLAQAVPKGERFEVALQKSVELGVSEIVPVVSRRTVPTLTRGAAGRVARWGRIVESAVGQSGRTRLPLLHPPRSWAEVVASAGDFDLAILLGEAAGAGIATLFSRPTPPRSVLIAVGPEGGWEAGEVAEAVGRGFAVAGATGWCGMAKLFAVMPWNRRNAPGVASSY